MIDPNHSRPIDVHRWSEHPEARRLTDTVWEMDVFSEYKADAGSRGGPKPKLRYKDQLHVLILDLFVAWKTDPELCIGVAMGVDGWKTNSRYNALHLSKIIPTFINLLHEAGLIDLSKGSYSGPAAPTNRTTRIRASKRLTKLFADAQFGFADVEVAEGRETVILRNDDNPSGKSKPIDYEETRETGQWRRQLVDYNTLLSSSFIDMPSLEQPFIERAITQGKGAGLIQRIPIAPSNAFVRRVFSRGQWDRNGRFYGGWWQQINQEQRRQIYINDGPTVEIDFQGLHIAILSKEQGIALVGDPYDVAHGLIQGVEPEQQRAFLKHLVLTAINANSKKAAYRAFRENFSADAIGKRLRDEQLEVMLAAFVEKHPHLEHKLCSDQGIRLMFEDSKIAWSVLGYFEAQKIPVLCIHDSFIINREHQQRLDGFMGKVTEYFFGGILQTTVKLGEIFIDKRYDEEVEGARERTRGYLHRLEHHQEKKKSATDGDVY